MKVTFVCPTCQTNGFSYWEEKRPIADSFLYEVKCPNGHITEVGIGGFKYQRLFESGITALKAGYHREAASSFATSLERFYEYSIGVLLMNKFPYLGGGMFDEEAVKKFEILWRKALKLSERQLGAFCALYFNEFGECPLLFDESFSKSLRHSIIKNPVNFRNRVVHEGYIPTYEEALQYGEAVSKYIIQLTKIFQEKDAMNGLQDGIDRSFYMFSLERAMDFAKRSEPIRKISIGMGGANFLLSNTIYYALIGKSPSVSLIEYLDKVNA